jgi:hypothetical protein
MQHFSFRSHLLRLSSLSLTLAGVVSVLWPISPATAATYSSTYRSKPRDYATCASGLVGAGVSEAEAAAACGGALYPRDLSACVTRIGGDTAIEASTALSNCRRARRPVDLASCVISISDGASDETTALTVIDYCRRSLLPLRFSACVTGVRGETALSTAEVLQNCIAASSRPRTVLPSFVPIDQGIPATPSRITVPEEPEPLFTPPPATEPPLQSPVTEPPLQ